ncbi:hypothetical protein HNV08_08315 [Winogradskyella eckloniae]|uniref:hypothetical protein n=1 Tax=Winogradskyella eckloniae TaxID=1089306 RepID=UPI00156709AB|nr:hypothetical protein [Winogradskyella eckloniae]NRD20050.1 hypothetical protein [Winogradskyella eckloniae]
MKKKNKTKGIIVVILFILLILFMVSTAHTSQKIYSPDKQYSVYATTYMYSKLFCAVFSYMDCWHSGKIYLYDEIEEKVLETVFTEVTENYTTVNWLTKDMVSFENIDIKLPNDFWYLPRPIKNFKQ